MLILTETQKLQVTTTTTSVLHCEAAAADTDATCTPTSNVDFKSLPVIANTAATADLVLAPNAGKVRNIKHLSLHATTTADGVTVTLVDSVGPKTVELFDATLAADESITFDEGQGWRVLDATGAVKYSLQPATGRLVKPPTVYTSGSGNHTTDPKTSMVRIRLVGGGGAGGGGATSSANMSIGAGGAGGGYVAKVVAVSPNTAYAYAVGAAGTANSGATGGNGGNSTFTVGATTYTAAGGTGGTTMAAGTSALAQTGSAGGAGSNGDENVTGETGGTAIRRAAADGYGGDGGWSMLGAGGRGRSLTTGVGEAGSGYGGGGGGSCTTGTANLGGAGKAGVVIVEEYT